MHTSCDMCVHPDVHMYVCACVGVGGWVGIRVVWVRVHACVCVCLFVCGFVCVFIRTEKEIERERIKR